MPGACGLRPCARTHHRKVLCHTCPLGGAVNKYRRSISVWHLSRCRIAFRPAVLSAARIWRSVFRYLEISFDIRGPSPLSFTPIGGHRPAPEAPLIRGMQINIGVIQTVRDFLPFLCNSFLCNIICYIISVIAFSSMTISMATTCIYIYIYILFLLLFL